MVYRMIETIPYGFWLTGLVLIVVVTIATLLFVGWLVLMIRLGDWIIDKVLKDNPS